MSVVDRKLTKAEILWTRKCPLTCSYCAMIDYDFEKAPVQQMIKGVDRLADLGCGFFAIYGSSPLYDFDGLPEFVKHAESKGILTTVIVDAIDKKSFEKLNILHDHGLRSLTVSWDGNAIGESGEKGLLPIHVDKQTQLKSLRGLHLANRWEKCHPGLRDIEVVSTITRKNSRHIIEELPGIIAQGYWFSFDFIHPDRGQPGTKSKGHDDTLVFRPGKDEDQVVEFARAIISIKNKYKLVHQSLGYLNEVANNPEMITKFSWKCTGATFPSWVTIDADGTVLPCDDFWTNRDFKVWDFTEDKLAEFSVLYTKEIEDKCPGCAWSTHYDAVQIMENKSGFDEYVHIGA